MKRKLFITTNNEHKPYVFERLSKWRPKETFYDVTAHHSLYDYRTDEFGRKPTDEKFNPDNGTYVDGYFFQHKWWATERFYLLSNPFWMQGYNEQLQSESGEKVTLHAVDMDGDMFDPLYIELSDDCESARFYRRVK